jgi:hypothetical protein
MIDRTLFAFALLASGLVACSSTTTETASIAEAPPPDTSGWRLATGKVPTKAEFTALSATCEAKGGAVDSCLADLGLKRAP